MISAVESIKQLVRADLIGATCYVKNYNGEMTECTITRIDLFISNKGLGAKAHVKRSTQGTINYPTCVTLECYDYYNMPCEPIGFFNTYELCKISIN